MLTKVQPKQVKSSRSRDSYRVGGGSVRFGTKWELRKEGEWSVR